MYMFLIVSVIAYWYFSIAFGNHCTFGEFETRNTLRHLVVEIFFCENNNNPSHAICGQTQRWVWGVGKKIKLITNHFIVSIGVIIIKHICTDRVFLLPHGLPERVLYRHAIISPSKYNAYSAGSFPGTIYEPKSSFID